MRPPLITMASQFLLKASKGLVRDFGEMTHINRKVDQFRQTAYQRVTYILQEELQKAYPPHQIYLFEHNSSSVQSTLPTWGIYLLDGQDNFTHGLAYFSIGLGFYEHGVLTAALIYDPLHHELFWSQKGLGAFLNQTRLRINPQAHGIVAVDIHSMPYLTCAEACSRLNVRMCGATNLDLVYVAASRYAGFVSSSISCANILGSFFVREAGGFITDFQGRGLNHAAPSSVVAGSENFHTLWRSLSKSIPSSSKDHI